MTESARCRETIVIDLGLHVMVRRIARPPSGEGHDFTEHKLDFSRRVSSIEDRSHVAQRTPADLPSPARFVRHILRTEQSRIEVRAVGALVDGELAVSLGFDVHRSTCCNMYAAR